MNKLTTRKRRQKKNALNVGIRVIKKEVDNAKSTFKKYGWPTIDVTRKSVEETAASVIKIYEIYKQNDWVNSCIKKQSKKRNIW